jgi:hypothetical protein
LAKGVAILREPSGGTSYQTARLVFRTFAHLPRAIRTSAAFGTSTRVSPGFAPGRQRSRSFGSRRPRSPSVQYPEGYWPRGPDPHPRPVKAKDKVEGPSLSLREGALSFPRTREDAGLLGPCFKTGRRRRRAEDRAGRPRCTPGPFEHSLQDWKNGENPVGFSPSFH